MAEHHQQRRPASKNRRREDDNPKQKKEVEVDWPYAEETKQALFWNPQGKRNRGRPKNNWRRSAEQELRQIGLQWTQIERQAQNKPVENNCGRPMLQLGAKGVYINYPS